MNALITALTMASAAFILWRTLCNANAMGWHSCHYIRSINWLLSLGAFGLLVSPLYDKGVGDLAQLAVLIALAVLMGRGRRERDKARG